MKFGTKVIHAGLQPDPATGALMTPIYQSSTYKQSSPGQHQGFAYGRADNPTRAALQANLAALEGGSAAFCFGSGMAAIDALMRLLRPGDEVIATHDLYGGAYRLFTQVVAAYGIHFHFVNLSDPEAIRQKLNANTRMIWMETPTNPTLKVLDIRAVVEQVRGQQLWVAVDNTFASPYLQNPLELGADIVMHALTKYIAGHSDLLMGAVIVRDPELAERLAFIQNTCGAIPGPQDCFLTLRGIKTLALRMQRHSENGRAVAEFLAAHPAVAQVYWPGLAEHEGHAVAKAQMRDFGGMLSFRLVDDRRESALALMQRCRLFALAESLGGVESLIGHPVTMTHGSIPKEEREAVGITDSLIRLSVGIEDAEDLVADLARALAHV